MDPQPPAHSSTVSNLVPSWDDATDGGGSFEPAAAATVVERAVHAGQAPREVRLVTPPERFEAPGAPVELPERFSYDLLAEPEERIAHRPIATPVGGRDAATEDDDGLPVVDYAALHRRDIAREVLRARLVAIAEQREYRSAYEIAFILLAAAVAVLLAAPPLVQVLLAARGIQA